MLSWLSDRFKEREPIVASQSEGDEGIFRLKVTSIYSAGQ